jgi:hypothetical protein
MYNRMYERVVGLKMEDNLVKFCRLITPEQWDELLMGIKCKKHYVKYIVVNGLFKVQMVKPLSTVLPFPQARFSLQAWLQETVQSSLNLCTRTGTHYCSGPWGNVDSKLAQGFNIVTGIEMRS